MVAYALRNAAALWAAGRHKDALPLLLRAAESSEGGTAHSNQRAAELARAAYQLSVFVQGGEDPKSIPISIHFDVESIDVQSIQIDSKEVEVIEEAEAPKKPAAPPAKPKPLVLDQTLNTGHKMPGAPANWPFPKKQPPPAPAAVPKSETLKEAPSTEPDVEDDPHGAPTRRMEDIETRRDHDNKKR